MAKKRKASARSQEPQGEIALDPRDARKRIRTYEDVADSDDEFHLNQDEIRLGEEPEAKRRRKWAEKEEFLQPSDEEVLDYSEGDDASDSSQANTRDAEVAGSDSEDDAQDEEEDADEGLAWGTSKADLYGADEIETEEQALEEEAEALRLQKKQLASMNAADYGFDEDEWQQGDAETGAEEKDQDVVTEVLLQLEIPSDLGPVEKLKLLKSRYPEFDLLTKDLLSLRDVHSSLLEASKSSTIARIKLRAASAYIGALVMYFSLFTSTASRDSAGAAPLSAVQLRDHPVMDSLVKCRELWANVKSLPDEDILERLEETSDPQDSSLKLDDHEASEPVLLPPKKKTRAERHAEALQVADDEGRAERLRRTEAGLADLDALIAPAAGGKKSKSKSLARQRAEEDSDLGEDAPLTAQEAADKAKRKKSLRFYSSQIAQKANKRGTAGRNAGGDDDIPYRERLRDRQARLNAEAEKRGKRGADIGNDLGGDSDEDDHRQAQKIRADAEDDEYYDLIAARTTKKKGDKAALAEAQRQAALQGGQVIQEATVGEDGKRKISYLIEKNKGLTPHRKKDVRNPRVKKKKKFEEKKKKLASMKPVYKGGEGRGGYGGELTGIKKNLVKATKL